MHEKLFSDWQVTDNTAVVTQQGFGLAAFVNKNIVQDANNRYTEYGSITEIEDAGFDDTTSFYNWAALAFSQQRVPKLVVSIWQDDAEDVDDALSAVPEAKRDLFYYVSIEERTNAAILLAAAWVTSRKKIIFAQTSSAGALAGTPGHIGLQLKALSYTRVYLHWQADDGDFADGALCGIAAAADLDTRKLTMRNKTLVGVPVNDISEAQMQNLLAANVNTYVEAFGRGMTVDGKASSGEYLDIQTSKDWIKARYDEASFFVLASEPDSLPLDNSGLAKVEGAVRSVTDVAIRAKHVLAEIPAVYQFPAITDISPADRANRIIRPKPKVTVVFAGAIHSVEGDVEVGK